MREPEKRPTKEEGREKSVKRVKRPRTTPKRETRVKLAYSTKNQNK